jgi:integrase
MQRARLTPDRIRRFTCPPEKQQAYLWDTDAPRLAVRATAGSKAFVFEGKLDRRTIRCTIGDVADWATDDARAEARRLATLIDQRIDPREQKAERAAATEARREAARRIEAPSRDAWNSYVEARRAKWSALSLRDHQRAATEGGEPRTRGRRKADPETTLPGALVPLLALPLAKIDADAVRAWLKGEATRRPTQAALSFRLLRAFLRWCGDHPEYRNQVHADACGARLARDELPRRSAKTDCLQREQLKAWFAAVRGIANPTIAAYLQALLLTGARREELAGLRWADVDFCWNGLHIADKIEEAGRAIPLTPFVAALLLDLKRRNVRPLRLKAGEKWEPSPWVFASATAKSGRLQDPSIAHRKAVAVAGLPPLTLHGLRRSFGTLSEWVECPVGVVAQIMGHKPSATAEKHYRQRPIDLLRMWHSKIEAWILNEAGIEFVPTQAAAPPLRLIGGSTASAEDLASSPAA